MNLLPRARQTRRGRRVTGTRNELPATRYQLPVTLPWPEDVLDGETGETLCRHDLIEFCLRKKRAFEKVTFAA